MVAPNLVFFLLAYSAIGTWLTTSVFGKRLMQLTYVVLKREGDLRFTFLRTRENSGRIRDFPNNHTANASYFASQAFGFCTRLQ